MIFPQLNRFEPQCEEFGAPQGPRVSTGTGAVDFANGESQVITRVGGTLGFASQVAYDPKTKIGVVVLSNSVHPTTRLLSQSSAVGTPSHN